MLQSRRDFLKKSAVLLAGSALMGSAPLTSVLAEDKTVAPAHPFPFAELDLDEVEKLGYKLDFSIINIKPSYTFSETCQLTVPAAIRCFLESTDYLDCIRMAVSLGGDADTLACIAGGIAEAYYGKRYVNKRLAKRALATLPADLLGVYRQFNARFIDN